MNRVYRCGSRWLFIRGRMMMAWLVFAMMLLVGYYFTNTIGFKKVFVIPSSREYVSYLWVVFSLIVASPVWYLSSFNVLDFYRLENGQILFRKISLIFTRDFVFDRNDIEEVLVKEDVFTSGKKILVRLRGASRFFVIDLKGEILDRSLFYTLLGITSASLAGQLNDKPLVSEDLSKVDLDSGPKVDANMIRKSRKKRSRRTNK